MRAIWSVALVVGTLAVSSPASNAATRSDKGPRSKAEPYRFGQIELKGSYPEGAEPTGLFGNSVETLSEIVGRLDKAADDEKLSGVILRINDPTLGWAKVNELQHAIQHLRNKGKRVVAYLDSATTHDYLVASSCDQIVMPESGELAILGLRAEVTFFKNLFDWLHLKADMLRVGEYKSAAEPFVRTEMSKEFRHEMEEILDDYLRQIVDGISKSRKIDRAKGACGDRRRTLHGPQGVRSRPDRQGRLRRRDRGISERVQAQARSRDHQELRQEETDNDFSGFAGMMKMMSLIMGGEQQKRLDSKPKVAVIHAVGAIMSGKSTSSFFGSETLGSETFIKAVRQAADEKTVKAIVLRVDSPGGSALASDLMWRALQKAGKPVIVSMGDVAASGGYYISMGASRIFAEPGTLTGSIGVVGGKVAIGGLLEKVGITTSVISRGKNSGAMSMIAGFTDSERQAMQRTLNDIYSQFTHKAAQGRKMDYEKLEKLARGRVYTGAMATKLGLVDELGTLDDAVKYAAQVAGLPKDEKIERWILPPAVNPLEAIFGTNDSDADSSMQITKALAQTLGQLSPELAEQLRSAWIINLLAREPRLTLMPFQIRVR